MAYKTYMEGKISEFEIQVKDLQTQLNQKVKTLSLKEQDILELENELEAKQASLIEHSTKQVERIESIQKTHESELSTLGTAHEKAMTL